MGQRRQGKLENILRRIKKQHTKPMGCNKSSAQREKYGCKFLHKERRKIFNNQLYSLRNYKKKSKLTPKLAERKK